MLNFSNFNSATAIRRPVNRGTQRVSGCGTLARTVVPLRRREGAMWILTALGSHFHLLLSTTSVFVSLCMCSAALASINSWPLWHFGERSLSLQSFSVSEASILHLHWSVCLGRVLYARYTVWIWEKGEREEISWMAPWGNTTYFLLLLLTCCDDAVHLQPRFPLSLHFQLSSSALLLKTHTDSEDTDHDCDYCSCLSSRQDMWRSDWRPLSAPGTHSTLSTLLTHHLTLMVYCESVLKWKVKWTCVVVASGLACDTNRRIISD